MVDLPDWATGMSSPMTDKLGFRLTGAGAGWATGEMPVAGNTQPFGYWHGGASAVLAETLASIAAWGLVQPAGKVYGVDLNVTHHRPVVEGWVRAAAAALFVGNSLATFEIPITNDSGDLMASARLTCRLLRGRG